jgi:hypothetical protein
MNNLHISSAVDEFGSLVFLGQIIRLSFVWARVDVDACLALMENGKWQMKNDFRFLGGLGFQREAHQPL